MSEAVPMTQDARSLRVEGQSTDHGWTLAAGLPAVLWTGETYEVLDGVTGFRFDDLHVRLGPDGREVRERLAPDDAAAGGAVDMAPAIVPDRSDDLGGPIELDLFAHFARWLEEPGTTLSVTGLPPGIDYDPARLTLSGTFGDDAMPDQAYVVEIEVMRGGRAILRTRFSWTVRDREAGRERHRVGGTLLPPPPVAAGNSAAVLFAMAAQMALAARASATQASRKGVVGENGTRSETPFDYGTNGGEGGAARRPSDAGRLFDLQTTGSVDAGSDEGEAASGPATRFTLQGAGAGTSIVNGRGEDEDGPVPLGEPEVEIEDDAPTNTVGGTGIVNNPPIIEPLPLLAAIEDNPLDEIDVLANAIDPDGDALTIRSARAENGIVSIENGTLTYLPNPDFNGQDTVEYVIDDGRGGQTTGDLTIIVAPVNDAPTIGVIPSRTTREDVEIGRIAVLDRARDVDGDELTVTTAAATNGIVYINGDGTLRYVPDANYNGPDAILFTVDDGNGGVATGTVGIEVTSVNDPPVIGNTFPEITNEDVQLTGLDVLQYAVDTEDDRSALRVVAATAASGTVTINPNGSLNYDPDPDFNGQDFILFTIADSEGGTADGSVAVTVNPVNDAPVAVADAATVDEDGAVTIDVLGNDLDVDGDALTVVTATALNGTVTIEPDGRLTYAPDPDYYGADVITYTVQDPSGATDQGSVSLTVDPVNDRPVANDDAITASEDTSNLTLGVTGNDTDVDGTIDPLTLVLVTRDAFDNPVPVTDPTLDIPGVGSWRVDTGSIVFDAEPDWNGVATIEYVVADDEGLASAPASVTYTISPVNDAPVLGDDAATTNEDVAVTIDVLANDADTDGDTLGVVAASAPNGTVVIEPDGRLLYTPNADFNGTDTITYTVSDGTTTVDAAATVTVNPINDAPRPVDDTATIAEDGGPITIDVLANDVDVDDAIDPTTLRIEGAPDPAEGMWSVTGGSIVFTPAADFDGTATATYTVTDATGDRSVAATVSVDVTPVNDAPVANDDTAVVDEDGSVLIDVLANDTDIDGDALTITVVSVPSGNGVATIESGQVRYTPNADFNGTDTIAYTLSDGTVLVDASVAVTVTPVNDAPVLGDDAATTNEDVAVTIDVLANDADTDGDTLGVVAASAPNGTVVIEPDGRLLYTPNADFNGTDTITYTVSDGTTTVDAAATVTVNPIDDAPVANDDAATVDEDGSILIDVLANDTDVDGDALTITGVTPGANGAAVIENGRIRYTPNADFNGTDTIAYTMSDGTTSVGATVTVTVNPVNDAPRLTDDVAAAVEDGGTITIGVLPNDMDVDGTIDPTTVRIEGTPDPTQGTWTARPDGSIDFTPAPDFNGVATASYSVADDMGARSAPATITVNVAAVNDAPMAVADSASTPEDVAVTIDVLANDTDIDGTPDPATVRIVGTAAPGDGLTVAGEGVWSVDGGTGAITFTPATNFTGPVTAIQYTVDDDLGETSNPATVSVTLTAVDDAPVLDLSDVGNAVASSGFNVGTPGNWAGWTAVGPFESAGVARNAPAVTIGGDGVTASLTQAGLTGLSSGPGDNGSALLRFDLGWNNSAPAATDEQSLTLSVGGTDYLTFTTVPGSAAQVTPTYLNGATGPGAAITESPFGDWIYGSLEVHLPTGVADTGDIVFTWTNLPGPESVHNDISIDNVEVIVADADASETGHQVIYQDGAPSIEILDPTASVSDIDGTTLATARVSLVNAEIGDAFTVGGIAATDGASGTVGGLAWTATVAGGTITIDLAGTATHADYLVAMSAIRFSSTAGVASTRNVEVSVNDGTSDSPIALTQIVLGADPQAPTPSNDTGSGDEDTATTVDVLANDVAGTNAIDPTSVWIDGAVAPGDGLTVTGQGVWSVNATTGAITFTPEADYNGTPTPIRYSVADTTGHRSLFGTVDVTVNPVDDAPVAVDDVASVVEDGSVTIDVLANDSDLEGDALAVQPGSPSAANGAVVLNGDGTITYTPNANFNGTDTIDYMVVANGLTDVGQVAVTVSPQNDPPVATPDTATGSEDAGRDGVPAITGTLADDASDPDGDTLAFSLASQGTATSRDLVASMLTGAGGYVEVQPRVPGSVTFTFLGRIESGDAIFRVSNGTTMPADWTLRGPPGGDSYALNVPAETSFTISVGDVGNGTTFTLRETATGNGVPGTGAQAVGSTAFNPPLQDITFATTYDSGTGIVTGNGTALGTLTLDGATGAYDFATSTAFDALTDGRDAILTFGYGADDGNGGTDTSTLTVTVNGANDAPTGLAASGRNAVTSDGGNAAYFQATDADALVAGRTSFTYEVQFSYDGAAGVDYIPLFSYNTDVPADELELAISVEAEENAPHIEMQIAGHQIAVRTWDASPALDGAVHTLTYTWDNGAGDYEIFLDGVSVTSGTGLATGRAVAGGGEVIIGQEQDLAGGGFDPTQRLPGTLVDARFFDRVRTPAEIAASAGTTVPSNEPGLLANWRFAESTLNGTIGTVTDVVSGNDLLLDQAIEPGFTASRVVSGLTIDENAGPVTVATLSATDPDVGDTHTYSIVSDPSGLFQIVGDELRTTGSFDHEAGAIHDVVVRATDGGGLTYDETVSVHIADVNEASTGMRRTDFHSGVAMNLDGDDGALTLADASAIFGGRTALTVEVAFTATLGADERSTLVSYDTLMLGDQVEIELVMIAGVQHAVLEIGGQEIAFATNTAPLGTGRQHQVAVTWDNASGDWAFFVDGTRTTSGTGLQAGHTLGSGGILTVGQDRDGGVLDDPENAFHGTIDEVRIFSDVRTDAEIAAGQGVVVDDFDLVARWDMREFDGGAVGGSPAGGSTTPDLVFENATEPGFTPSTVEAVTGVRENAAVGETVLTLQTDDPDEGDFFIYTIDADTSGGAFAIVGNALAVADPTLLDNAVADRHEVTVTSTDLGGHAVSDTFTVRVTQSDSPPTAIARSTFLTGYEINDDGNAGHYALADAAPLLGSGLTAITAEVAFSGWPSGTSNTLMNLYNGGVDELNLAVAGFNGTQQVYIEIADSGASVDLPVSATLDGDAHTLSLTWDSVAGDWTLYLDGAAIGSGSGMAVGHTIAAGTLSLGQELDAGGVYDSNEAHSGTLFEARLFDDARTSGEVASNWNRTISNTTPGLLANWHFSSVDPARVANQAGGADTALTYANVTGAGFTPSTPEAVLGVVATAVAGDGVAVFTASDPDPGDTFTFEVIGGRSDLFEFVGADPTLRLRTGVTLDPAEPEHDLLVRVTDSEGGTFEDAFTVQVLGEVVPFLDLDASAPGVGHETAHFEGGGPRPLAAGTFLAADPQDDVVSITIDVSGATDGASERLMVGATAWSFDQPATGSASGSGYTANVDSTDGVRFTITHGAGGGQAFTQAELDALVADLAYDNVAVPPTAGTRDLAITLADALGNASSGATTSMSIVTSVAPVGSNPITGTPGGDTLVGTTAVDEITTFDGFDTVNAGAGDDHVFGGGDGDTFHGEGGNDYLRGDDGTDTLRGGDGHDWLVGGAAPDDLFGGDGDDRLEGGSAGDDLTGGAGDDVLFGGVDPDRAFYSGVAADYEVMDNGDGTHTVTDRRAGSPDGTDLLQGIETLVFSDQTVAIGTVAVASPVALDLNRSGAIETTGPTTSADRSGLAMTGALRAFDMDGDGDLEAVEWMAGTGDALLVDNTDGHALTEMNGTRLFGDHDGRYANGYEQLAERDADGDGQLAGGELEGLALWTDDGDAVAEEDELFTLADMGLTALDVRPDVEEVDGRAVIRASATMETGERIMSEDVWFARGASLPPDLTHDAVDDDLVRPSLLHQDELRMADEPA